MQAGNGRTVRLEGLAVGIDIGATEALRAARDHGIEGIERSRGNGTGASRLIDGQARGLVAVDSGVELVDRGGQRGRVDANLHSEVLDRVGLGHVHAEVAELVQVGLENVELLHGCAVEDERMGLAGLAVGRLADGNIAQALIDKALAGVVDNHGVHGRGERAQGRHGRRHRSNVQGTVDAHGTRAHATRALNGEQAVAGQRLVAAHENLIALGAAACLHEALVGQVATRSDNDLRGRELLHAVGGANLHARNGASGLVHHEVDELGAHEFLAAGRLKLAQHLVHEVRHALAAAGSSAHGKHIVGLHLGGIGEGAAMAHEPVVGSLGVRAHQLREAGVALALALCVEGVHHLLDALVGVLHREEELAAGDARVACRAHSVFLGDNQDVLHAVLKQAHARAQACQA